jgi:hypothetical protein
MNQHAGVNPSAVAAATASMAADRSRSCGAVFTKSASGGSLGNTGPVWLGAKSYTRGEELLDS